MNKFIFDVDGTLTPSRQKIDKEFANWFEHFATHNAVYLVTGSDRDKTIEQVGQQIYNLAVRVYNCSGSDVYEQDRNVRTSDWTAPKELYDLMHGWLQASKFPARMGQHIEERPGMINFSVVGRGATLAERKMYVKYDTETKERENIAFQINLEFDNITATVGGETGLDIAPTGADKSQILVDFNHEDHIHFFGDRMDEGGNDYPLKKALWDGYYQQTCYHITDWQDTWEKLKCV